MFGLTAGDVADLELVNDQRLAQSNARAVLFRQKFGDLTPALASMVTVGVANGEIAYASSSITQTTGTPPAATLTPCRPSPRPPRTSAARSRAASSTTSPPRSPTAGPASRSPASPRSSWSGCAPSRWPTARVRPVFETNVVDVQGGSAFAYTLMVDGVSGEVLHRQNQAESHSDAFPFQGEITATECGPKHEFELTDDATRQIVAVAAMANTLNDAVVKIFGPNDELLVSGDLGTSPETATYSAESIPAGVYSMQVCPFDAPDRAVPAAGQLRRRW